MNENSSFWDVSGVPNVPFRVLDPAVRLLLYIEFSDVTITFLVGEVLEKALVNIGVASGIQFEEVNLKHLKMW